jgi:serine/threonine-protein kinase
MLRRFMNEALAAGTLGHPNIVESTDMGFTKTDVPYIVFEYLEGTGLFDEIYRVGGLPPRRALKIARQIASAVGTAHDANIIHRDLKSENIFLTTRQEVTDHVKVLDFGISRFLEARDQKTRMGIVMGTPEFLAPEQITDPDTIDGRADIYALGVLLYEMLAARVPFSREGEAQRKTRARTPDLDATHALLHKILEEPPPPLDRPDAPPGLPELIRDKLLAKDRKQRFQSMKEVQTALGAFDNVLRRTGPVPVVATAATPEIESIADITISGARLGPEELAREVKTLGPRWSIDHNELVFVMQRPKMADLAQAISHIAEVADEMDHHPRVVVVPPRLELAIRTNDAITVLDLVFAARLEQWLRERSW